MIVILFTVMLGFCLFLFVFFFKQKTAYEMRISDWSSDVCSSDRAAPAPAGAPASSSDDRGRWGRTGSRRHAWPDGTDSHAGDGGFVEPPSWRPCGGVPAAFGAPVRGVGMRAGRAASGTMPR